MENEPRSAHQVCRRFTGYHQADSFDMEFRYVQLIFAAWMSCIKTPMFVDADNMWPRPALWNVYGKDVPWILERNRVYGNPRDSWFSTIPYKTYQLQLLCIRIVECNARQVRRNTTFLCDADKKVATSSIGEGRYVGEKLPFVPVPKLQVDLVVKYLAFRYLILHELQEVCFIQLVKRFAMNWHDNLIVYKAICRYWWLRRPTVPS